LEEGAKIMGLETAMEEETAKMMGLALSSHGGLMRMVIV
jgi:hypothetical protein